MTYKFSVPMPFKKNHINELQKINKAVEKSKIRSLYFSLPTNSPDFTGFEQGRCIYDCVTDFEYWKPLIDCSLEKEFDFIYLLNSPKVYNPEFDNINKHLEKLDRLLNNLRKLGCNKLRVCNPQLIEYLNSKYPEFTLYLSTSSELQNIKQYTNLFNMFNNIKEFVPAFDLNKNFIFLKNIKDKYPYIEIELMVNEGCINGCPIRNSHNIFVTGQTKINSNYIFSSNFFLKKCNKLAYNNFNLICNPNIIYPWEIAEYSKIGINKFKLVGRNNPEFKTGGFLIYYKYYLIGIENIKKISNVPIRYFNNYIYNNKNIIITVQEAIRYLPNIKHFKKNGHLCSSYCGISCKYCLNCVEKMQNISIKQQNIRQNEKICV